MHNMEDLKRALFGLVRQELDLKKNLQRPSSDSCVLSNTTWTVVKDKVGQVALVEEASLG